MCGDNETHSICLYVSAGQNNIIPINAFGKFHIKMSAVWYFATDQNHEKVIQFRSPQFRLKYSSGNVQFNSSGIATTEMWASPYPIIIYNPDHQVGGLNGMYQWDMDLEGQIELQLVRVWGVDVNVNDTCIINLELTPIGKGGSQ
jgi:hypothetical protein